MDSAVVFEPDPGGAPAVTRRRAAAATRPTGQCFSITELIQRRRTLPSNGPVQPSQLPASQNFKRTPRKGPSG